MKLKENKVKLVCKPINTKPVISTFPKLSTMPLISDPKSLKIIACNLNGIRAALKKDLDKFIQKEDPDIFFVGETKVGMEKLNEFLNSPEFLQSALSRYNYSSRPRSRDRGTRARRPSFGRASFR